MIESLEKIDAFTDSRNNGCLLIKDKEVYRVSGENILVTYNDTTFQYLVVGTTNEFWDPVTNHFFRHVDGVNYKCSLFKYSFSYVNNHYISEEINPDLERFLGDVWELKSDKKNSSDKEILNYIYKIIYSKEGDNKKISSSYIDDTFFKELVEFSKLVDQSEEMVSFTQNEVIVEEDVLSIKVLFLIFTDEESDIDEVLREEIISALSGYHYYGISKKVAWDSRIVLNVAPANMYDALSVIWPIVSKSKLVYQMKAGGPYIAKHKLDSIVIYVDSKKDGYDQFLDAIKKSDIVTEELLPALLSKIAKGIGVGSEPRKLEEVQLSFGQKRTILSFLALCMANTKEEMLALGISYFRQAGIDIVNPGYELTDKITPDIQKEIVRIYRIWVKE
jgi:hypothetical protein